VQAESPTRAMRFGRRWRLTPVRIPANVTASIGAS
jgi:hypothetical protein